MAEIFLFRESFEECDARRLRKVVPFFSRHPSLFAAYGRSVTERRFESTREYVGLETAAL
jgi:hypothetical protein